MTQQHAATVMLKTAVGLLEQGRALDHLSRVVTLAALVGAVLVPLIEPDRLLVQALLMAAVAAGMVQTYFGLRVGFDAALFRMLLEDAATPDLAALDDALRRMHLLPAGKSGRDLAQRIAGACRLFFLQGIALMIQLAAVLGGAIAVHLG